MFGKKPLKVLAARLVGIVSPALNDYVNITDTSDNGLAKRVLVSALLALGVTKTSSTGSATIPAGTTAQRDASPQEGYTRANQTTNGLEAYINGAWRPAGQGAAGGGTDRVFVENDQSVTTDYTISTNRNAHSVGPITINTGITVTIPTGSTWLVQ